MAADQTAERIATKVLAADTAWVINLTDSLGTTADLCHHGGSVTDVVYFDVASTEAGLVAFSKADPEVLVLLPGERRRVQLPENGTWIRLLSNGTAGVTVEGHS